MSRVRGRVAAILTAVAAVAGLALSAGVANASTTPVATAYTDLSGNSNSEALAGWQVYGNGLTAYNDVRGTFHVPAGSTTNPALLMQARSNVGGQTEELAFVQQKTSAGDCAQGQFELMADSTSFAKPGPLPVGDLSTSLLGGSVICESAPFSYYTEIYYSTKSRDITFLAGPVEFTDVIDLGHIYVGFHEFHSPAIGGHYNGPLPTVSTSQLSTTRVGLTKLLCETCSAGGTDKRITFSDESLQEVFALATWDGSGTWPNGDHPTVTDPVFLQSGPIGDQAQGSAFTLTASS